MKKLLTILPNLSPGGFQTQNYLFCKGLKDKYQYEIEVWGVNSWSDTYIKSIESIGFKVKLVPELNFILSAEYGKISIIKKLKSWISIVKKINKSNPDVIMPYSKHLGEKVGIACLFSKSKKSFLLELGQTKEPSKLPNSIYRRVFKLSKPWYCSNSKHGCKSLEVEYNLKINSTILIRNGLAFIPEFKSDKINSSPRNVIMVANFFNTKEHSVAIQAWNRVKESKINAGKLLFIGYGKGDECSDNFESAKQLASILNLTNEIDFIGEVEDGLKYYMNCASIGLLATSTEGFSNTILEYMAEGLPIVSSVIPGVMEALPKEQYNYLYTPGDPNDLAEKLIALLRMPEKELELLAENNWTHVGENFHINQQVDKLHILISSIC